MVAKVVRLINDAIDRRDSSLESYGDLISFVTESNRLYIAYFKKPEVKQEKVDAAFAS